MIVKCPRCGKEHEMTGNPYRPFCGERCKLLDLGNWLDESYRIPEENPPDDGMETAPGLSFKEELP